MTEANSKKPNVLQAMLLVTGISCFRFKMAARLWVSWLVIANLAALAFITNLEAQVVYGAAMVAWAFQGLIYMKQGFTRILGVTHVLWIPMIVWIASRLDTIEPNSPYRYWLVIMMATNIISLIIDAIEAVRYLRGDREPHYSW